MHSYATDSHERKRVNGALAIAGVGLALLLNWVLQATAVDIPWWVDAPAVMGFYGILYTAFDRYLWKVRIVHKIGLVKVSDLSGTWEGDVCSSFDDHSTKIKAKLIIKQTWTKLSVHLRTNESESYSQIGAILTEPNIEINYQYSNEPRSDSRTTMHAHRGTAWLALNGSRLEGEYYTGRDRKNHGKLLFSR